MSEFITASREPLSKVFGDEYDFQIPNYQRPYSWEKDQAFELLDDLITAAKAWDEENESDGYFLGCLLLIHQKGKPKAEVVDGQQRLTTLTILLALLANRHEKGERQDLMEHITRRKKGLLRLTEKPRLELRDQDKDFFKEYIQDVRIKELLDKDIKDFDIDSQRNIRNNAQVLDDMIKKEIIGSKDLKLTTFERFLLNSCYLVVVTTPIDQSAFQLFEVLNNRGLKLRHSDILKTEVINKVADVVDITDGQEIKRRDKYSGIWEDAEARIGRKQFEDLFTHLYMIYFRGRPHRDLIAKLKDKLMESSGEAFIDCEIKRYADLSYIIDAGEFVSGSEKDSDINEYFKWLTLIDNKDWWPVALEYLKLHSKSPSDVHWFFKKLERLAGAYQVCNYNMNVRRSKYVAVLQDLGAGEVRPASIELSGKEIEATLSALDQDVYKIGKVRRNRYLVQRLDSFMSNGAMKYQVNTTIEHVMPQKLKDGSQWEEWWPDSVRHGEWVNRLANLVLLDKRINASASNDDFSEKKIIYGKNSKGKYPLTFGIIDRDVEIWNEEHLEKRQIELVGKFKEHWCLIEKK